MKNNDNGLGAMRVKQMHEIIDHRKGFAQSVEAVLLDELRAKISTQMTIEAKVSARQMLQELQKLSGRTSQIRDYTRVGKLLDIL